MPSHFNDCPESGQYKVRDGENSMSYFQCVDGIYSESNLITDVDKDPKNLLMKEDVLDGDDNEDLFKMFDGRILIATPDKQAREDAKEASKKTRNDERQAKKDANEARKIAKKDEKQAKRDAKGARRIGKKI